MIRGMCENEFETYIIMWEKLRYLCIKETNETPNNIL